MSSGRHLPKGPSGTWKTGQRVPESGNWVDQHGSSQYFTRGSTFPPCIDRKGECANRFLVAEDAVAAA